MTEERASTAGARSEQRLPAVIYSSPARAVAAALTAISRGSLLAILALLLLSEGPVNPLRLIRLVGALCIVPGIAVFAVRRILRGELRVEGTRLILVQRNRRVEVPIAAIAGLEPWRLPLPGSGAHLRLRSGERWRDGIEMVDPGALPRMLVACGAAPELAETERHPHLVYARARSRSARRSWRHYLLAFPIFALGATIPLFRVHQIIAYGGAFGEYRLYGLGAYLTGFAVYWATLTIYLMLYAAALRVPVELLAAASAALSPRHAQPTRDLLERLAGVAYFAGVPIAVILRFVPW
jgi:apolipoprotein N-acyltransferase